MGLALQRAKKQTYQFHRKHEDCCPKCRTHFRRQKAIILWRDVVECGYCGNIWVLLNLEEFLRWL